MNPRPEPVLQSMDLALFDEGMLCRSLGDIGREQAREILDVFKEQLDELIALLRRRIAGQDAAGLPVAVHSLRSSAWLVGARPLSLNLEELEQVLERGAGMLSWTACNNTLQLAVLTGNSIDTALAPGSS